MIIWHVLPLSPINTYADFKSDLGGQTVSFTLRLVVHVYKSLSELPTRFPTQRTTVVEAHTSVPGTRPGDFPMECRTFGCWVLEDSFLVTPCLGVNTSEAPLGVATVGRGGSSWLWALPVEPVEPDTCGTETHWVAILLNSHKSWATYPRLSEAKKQVFSKSMLILSTSQFSNTSPFYAFIAFI